jgi:solute carrier family 6 amino acid transporter-like protein 5/7/9/14
VEAADLAPDRMVWDSQWEFLMSCISMSVGLGNVWRFPVTAFNNGGGAFLIPYLVVLVFIGRPIYFMELCLGQFTSFSQVKVWKCVPAFKGN